MTKPSTTFERYSVWLLPFPFADSTASKRRPAVVLSRENTFNAKVGHSVMAMITTAKYSKWPLDTIIKDLASAGLTSPCVIRMKLFTLDHRLAVKRLGKLSDGDAKKLEVTLKRLL